MPKRFTPVARLGKGAMGEVWRATDDRTGETVALKFMHVVLVDDESYRKRFEREAALARRVDSPNVVKILDFGTADGRPYLVLEHVDGRTLRDAIAEHGPYQWPEARELLVDIALGLAAIHEGGILHRDLKPSNVLVSSYGVAKIADFGIAKSSDLSVLTGTEAVLGTPTYLAPEGAKDARSDLYGLGVIAYELLVGEPPFKGDTFQEVLLAHMSGSPDLARVPREARALVSSLLAKNPEARLQSAQALLSALRTPGMPVEVPASPSTLPVPRRRRRPAFRRWAIGLSVLGASAGVVLALALVLRSPLPGDAAGGTGGSESFAGTALGDPGAWRVATNRSGVPCLTAASTEQTVKSGSIDVCAGERDVEGQGRLRLAEDREGIAAAIESTRSLAPTSGLTVDFEFAMYDGDGDGLTFFLRDGSTGRADVIGGGGKQLGYTEMPGAVVGVGFDRFGWFTNGCSSGISVHTGEAGGYAPLGCAEGVEEVVTTRNGGRGSQWDEAPADRASGTRWVRIVVDPTTAGQARLHVLYSKTGPDALMEIIAVPMPQNYARLSDVRFGFAAATGAATQYAEIGNVSWAIGP